MAEMPHKIYVGDWLPVAATHAPNPGGTMFVSTEPGEGRVGYVRASIASELKAAAKDMAFAISDEHFNKARERVRDLLRRANG